MKKAAALRSKLSITENQSNRLVEAYEQVGFDFTYVEAAAIGETNWAPLVIAMKNQDVGFMTLTSSFEEAIPLQNEMALQGFEPDLTELETNFYNAKYPAQAGSVADGTIVRLTVLPFEEADRNPPPRRTSTPSRPRCRDRNPSCWACRRSRPGCCGPRRSSSSART